MSTLSGWSQAQALPYAIPRWQENQFERCLRRYGNSGYSITLSSFLSIDREINITESHNCAQPTCRSRSSSSSYYYYLLSTQKASWSRIIAQCFCWWFRIITGLTGTCLNRWRRRKLLSFFLLPKRKKKFPAAKKKKKKKKWWTWDLEQYHDDRQSQGSLGPQPEENQKPPPSGGRDGWKESAQIKKKAGRKGKQKSPSFSCWDEERGGAILWRIFFVFCDPLSLSIWEGQSVSPYRRPQRVHVVTLMLRPEWRLRSL